MNLPDGHLLMLELAALLHDLGVNEGPGASAEEGAGPGASPPADKQGGAPLLENVIATILRRHEKGEGSAYPEGFAGSDIPRIDNIVAVADGFARLTRGAPEDRVLGFDAALAEMLGDSSGRYDPEAVLALQRLREKGNLAELL
jgi:HD-GYP domain-containing protein (c-di-GMP phosphodiesterase class II)